MRTGILLVTLLTHVGISLHQPLTLLTSALLMLTIQPEFRLTIILVLLLTSQ
jgi:hypothetical protein